MEYLMFIVIATAYDVKMEHLYQVRHIGMLEGKEWYNSTNY